MRREGGREGGRGGREEGREEHAYLVFRIDRVFRIRKLLLVLLPALAAVVV